MWILDNGFSQKLQGLLSDPDAAARIASVAGALASSGAIPQGDGVPEVTEAGNGSPAPSAPAAAVRDPRVALLYSLKPLLRAERRSKVDELARAMSMVALLGEVRKRGD